MGNTWTICRSDGCGTHPRLDSYEPTIKDNGIQ
jgi:hypothetical protein